MSKFSERLKALRNSEGLSQNAFAEILGISRSTLSGYENEGKEPNNAMLFKLADHFDVSIDYLLGRSDERFHADVVFRKDGVNFRKHFAALGAAERAIVADTFDAFYVLLFRDVAVPDRERLGLYRELLQSLSANRSAVKKHIDANMDGVTNAAFLTSLMEIEGKAKEEVAEVLDKLMQSDLAASLKKNGK